MEITGTLVQILPEKTGTGKNGTWKKQEIILETDGQYPKKICFSFWGDKIDKSLLREGTMLNVSFDLESREFNGRWYTEAKAWRAQAVGSAPDAGAPPFQDSVPPEYQSFGGSQPSSPDDLPF